jgi:hypothetical protein
MERYLPERVVIKEEAERVVTTAWGEEIQDEIRKNQGG